MPALQVKDFPGDLYEELRSCAASADRSLAQQTTHIIKSYLETQHAATEYAWQAAGSRAVTYAGGNALEPPAHARSAALVPAYAPAPDPTWSQARKARRERAFAAIDALPPFDVPDDFPDAAELVRGMREARDARCAPLTEAIA